MKGTKTKGINELLWPMQQISRERTEREIAQVNTQIERMRGFGMSEEELNARFGDVKYVTEPAAEGSYRVILTAGGQTHETTAEIMRDHWHNR